MLQRPSPRELSNQLGYSSLNQSELWSLILRFGTRKNSVYAVSAQVTPLVVNSLEHLWPTQKLKTKLSSLGVGKVQAHSILATYELLLRIKEEKSQRVKYSKPIQFVEMFHSLTKKKQEYVYGIYLSPRLNLVHKELLTKGTTDNVLIDVRDVLYFAVKHRVRHLVLLHNHPTGDPTPSQEDCEQTRRIAQAANSMSMTLVDHIIIGREGYYSFKESSSVL